MSRRERQERQDYSATQPSKDVAFVLTATRLLNAEKCSRFAIDVLCFKKNEGKVPKKIRHIKLRCPRNFRTASRIVRLLVAGSTHLRLHTRFPTKAHAVSSLFLRFSSTALVDRRASLTMSVLMTLSPVRLCMMPTRPIVGCEWHHRSCALNFGARIPWNYK